MALSDVSLDVSEHQFLSLLGPSGCGKSTLLRLIAGLSDPERRHDRLAGVASRHRSRFVFQEPTLMPWATALDNVMLPLRLAGVHADERCERATAALAQVGLAGFAKSYPRELSGGMKMRVSIARALVTRPKLLLMDEPFAALDEITRFKLNNDLLELWQRERLHRDLRHPLGVRERIPVAAHRRHGGAAGPVHRGDHRSSAPYPRDAEYRTSAAEQRVLPARLGGARRRRCAHG